VIVKSMPSLSHERVTARANQLPAESANARRDGGRLALTASGGEPQALEDLGDTQSSVELNSVSETDPSLERSPATLFEVFRLA
jgi:hypothetical protein